MSDPAIQVRAEPNREVPKTLFERLEAAISRLSTRSNVWHRICSMVWLPYAFRSGISMHKVSVDRFTAVLPFRRFNRNWYNAMAGAALLGNSEVAAGMYLFSRCGGDYIVVCKEMEYRFLRPCYGPAVYNITNCGDLEAAMSKGGEFNIPLEIDVSQQMSREGRDRKVGRCTIVFHCTPKSMSKARRQREERSILDAREAKKFNKARSSEPAS
ncbi:MAG: hypothetical protein O2800_02425 [Planctomycetota bacterium]|nr:hypothetical protein [Planctomycetota bacterium]